MAMNLTLKDGTTTYFTASYDEENNWIYSTWEGTVSDEQIVAAVEGLINMVKETQAKSWINDLQENQDSAIFRNAFTKEQREKIANDLYFHGLKNFAQVSKGFVSYLSRQFLKGERLQWFNFRNFATLEEAKAWLKSLETD